MSSVLIKMPCLTVCPWSITILNFVVFLVSGCCIRPVTWTLLLDGPLMCFTTSSSSDSDGVSISEALRLMALTG